MEKINLSNGREVWYDLFKTALNGIVINGDTDISVISSASWLADKALEEFKETFKNKNYGE